MEPKSESPSSTGLAFLPKSLGVKVGMLLAFAIMVAITLVVYVLYARGVFEATQTLVVYAGRLTEAVAQFTLPDAASHA